MFTAGRDGRARGGFTLMELLIVIVIIVVVSAATLPVIIPAISHRQVSEGARLLQATLGGARDAAIRANAPRGIRLMPDPTFNGPVVLAANRMIAIEPAADYNSGRIDIVMGDYPVTGNNFQLSVTESVFQNLSAYNANPGNTALIANEPTSWYWNIRQGDKIRFDDSGRYYTIAGPIRIGASNQAGTNVTNPERYINYGPPSYVPGPPPMPGSPPSSVQNSLNPYSGTGPNPNHYPEILHLVNGQDDDGDGWVDEGFDGIDNDGDGITDPGYNGIDDDGDGVVDNVAELLWSYNAAGNTIGYFGGEYEPEAFVGSNLSTLLPTIANQPPVPSFVSQRYSIVRRPVVSEGAREVALPQGVVIDLTTWNAFSAVDAQSGQHSARLPERSRLPVDPYSHFVDILIAPNGQVVVPGAGSGSLSSGVGYSPIMNMPFYHFWVAERDDVVEPMFGIHSNPIVPQSHANIAYMLPMPQGATNAAGVTYTPTGANGPYLKGDRRLVTLFVRTGQIVTNEIESFDPQDTNFPFYQAQFGTREAK